VNDTEIRQAQPMTSAAHSTDNDGSIAWWVNARERAVYGSSINDSNPHEPDQKKKGGRTRTKRRAKPTTAESQRDAAGFTFISGNWVVNRGGEPSTSNRR
jgi:hypothetical protein